MIRYGIDLQHSGRRLAVTSDTPGNDLQKHVLLLVLLHARTNDVLC